MVVAFGSGARHSRAGQSLGLINKVNDATIRGSPNGLSGAGHHTSGPALFMVIIVYHSLQVMAMANMNRCGGAEF